MNWNEGYRTDTVYTYGYYREMNPQAMRFLLLMAGYAPPEVSCACEPGYGQGTGLNIHAAAEDIAWYGTDFNPSQAAFAQEMAEASGARAYCYADSFRQFCGRTDLPEFDYIALHGIWSWITAENRAALTDLVDRKLRIGGVLYISYNAYPGWAPFKPTRDLMKLYMGSQVAQGADTPAKVRDTFAFIEKLNATQPAYFRANPIVEARLETFRRRDGNYLAHELLNEVWEPSSFAEMAAELGEARMTFACSANPLLVIPGLGMSDAQRDLLEEISDPVLRETVQDIILNTQFRKDFWIKGPRQLPVAACIGLLRDELVILTVRGDQLTREIMTAFGNITISEAALQVIRLVLSDGKVHDLGELEKAAQELKQRQNGPEGIEKENILTIGQALCALLAGGRIALAQKKQEALKARTTSEKLNLFLENLAIANGEVNHLASPVTGGGVAVSRFDMLFLLALRRNAKTAPAIAAFARECINVSGQQIVDKDKVITEPAEVLQYLQKQADSFLQERLPIFKDLLIA